MGPLQNIKVLEIEAVGPVPWCGMMLSDLGADVLRIDRPAPPPTLRQIPDHCHMHARPTRWRS